MGTLRHNVIVLLALIATATPAAAAMLRPLEGSGNFHSSVDVLDRREADGTTSVILLIAVPNRELTFKPRQERWEGELGIEAELVGRDGPGARLETKVAVRCQNREQANSPTVYQVLPIVLHGVKASSGKLLVTLQDRLRQRPGLLSQIKRHRWARSEVVGDWVALEAARAADGLTLGAPVFLARAPIEDWQRQGMEAVPAERSVLTEYLHPIRRYGLEQNHLQVYFEVEAPAGAAGAAATRDGIIVQILAKDLEFALRDTIALDSAQQARLAGGGTTGIFYDLNLKDLPPGAYQMGAASADGHGRAWLAEFDVIWSVASLNRFGDQLLGEGRTVLSGDQLGAFEEASQAEREAMLEKFWLKHDPDPATPLNEGYLEFRRRVSYVHEYLGGFGATGAMDPRGATYLLLGTPDEISQQVLPLNEKDQEDALVRVYDGYAPEREGTQIKGESGIPLPDTYQSRRDIAAKRHGIGREKGFELWEYNNNGSQLFPNRYSGQSLGLRFLFVDRTGTGSWVLESTNAVNLGS